MLISEPIYSWRDRPIQYYIDSDGCWVCTSHRIHTKDGRYYRIQRGGSRYLLHRYVYEVFVGEISGGLHVLHRCDNTLCINPEHLYVGTHQDNMKDRDSRGRGILPYMGSQK